MSTSRRDFMKLFGTSVAALLLARCKLKNQAESDMPMYGCYQPTALPITATPVPPLSALGRLRVCWMSFGELVQKTIGAVNSGSSEDDFGQGLISEHRAALDLLVADGKLTASVADLVQEAYAAAVYHVWRSNVPMTCYITAGPVYAPDSAAVLVRQSDELSLMAERGVIDPATLAKAQAALEHDLAFYALTDEDLQALYDRLSSRGGGYPAFDQLELDITPDARAAAQFILDLLTKSGDPA